MPDTYTKEMHMRVYDDGSGEYVGIGHDPDGLGCVHIYLSEDTNVRIYIPPAQARLVAEAMIKIADDIDGVS